MNYLTTNLSSIKTSKWIRSIEAIFEIFFQLLGVWGTFLLFNLFGEKIMGEDFSSDTLFSVLLLPALYILKGAHIIFYPFFVKVRISSKEVESVTGIFTRRSDKLDLKTVENIEVVSNILGRIFNYGTLYFYSYGAWVGLPFIMSASEIKNQLEEAIKSNS